MRTDVTVIRSPMDDELELPLAVDEVVEPVVDEEPGAVLEPLREASDPVTSTS